MLNMISLMLIALPVASWGLTGLGGASILVPILVLLGIPLKEAIASCMVTIIATSSGSASSYVKEGIANVKVAMYLEMFTTVVPFWVPPSQRSLLRFISISFLQHSWPLHSLN